MAIMSGLGMVGMWQVPVGKAAGLVVGLGLQEMAGLFSSHQIHVASPCQTE